MSQDRIEPNHLSFESPRSILECTFVAEYLLIKGYLVSDLDSLRPEVATDLLSEACKFTAFRLADMDSTDKFPWETQLSYFPN